MGTLDDIKRWGSERVDDHFHIGVIETNFHLARAHFIDSEASRSNGTAFEFRRKFGNVMTGQELIDKLTVLRGNHRIEGVE